MSVQCFAGLDEGCGNPASWVVLAPAPAPEGERYATCGDHLDDAVFMAHEYGCPVAVQCVAGE